MIHLTGAEVLIRLALRRDRVRLAIWVMSIAGLVYAQAVSIKGLYPDPAELAAAGRLVAGNAAFIAMAGPPLALDTLGGRVTFEISAFAMVLAALMNLLLVARHVRGEEEAGRAELLRSTIVGRHAPLAAALVVAVAVDVLLAILVTLGLLVAGLGTAGSCALAAAISGVGLFFAAVAAVTSQVTVTTRVASGLAGAVLAASFVLRAIGDIGNGVLSWLSPLGWGQSMRPFAGERWWPGALLVATATALTAAAAAINSHRDIGAGVLQPSPGPPRASRRLGRPAGLTLRLLGGTLLAWTGGLFLGGVAYGSVASDVEDLVGDSDTIADLLAQGGGTIVDSFLATTSLVLALVATGFALQGVLRLRSEERAGRAEAVLATAVSRWRWAATHLAVVAGGTVLVLAAAGLGTGTSYALAAGDGRDIARMVAAGVVYAPAVLVLAGLATTLYGLVPRALPLVWAAFAACFVIGFFGQLLSLPGWIQDLSPFQHVPKLPAAGFTLGPLVALTAVAAGLTVAGAAGFRRRDVVQ